nr:immunoglobulin light chain junction region [Macaca mulatta]MPN96705.1 immunoglobulin light chain junction region [Macaca mulatta]MPN98901.1 immunoglobulin light chain junction region [Macaca mulatta]MPO02247.1 immunoglobulin light chain junction region [Macaca mulatta]
CQRHSNWPQLTF